ncbi:MAG: pyridoxamine 5'-phosphate oxidase [Polyangiaceae bacterium]
MAGESPLVELAAWIKQAEDAGEPEPFAMTLATATSDGRPSARIVLCRGIDERGLRFFTNYESRKGRDLEDNPRAALVFHWVRLGRQARVEGIATKLSSDESDDYFRKRPRGHQISAHASPQSRPIPSLADLHERVAEIAAQYEGKDVPRPDRWGGFRVVPDAIELFAMGADRVHDRARFDWRGGIWTRTQLGP